MKFGFGDVVIDSDRFEIRNRGELRHVEPQVFNILCYLIEHRHRVVSRDELLEELWGGRLVSDSALNSRINAARRAVSDSGAEQSIIRTYFKQGFRFVADIDQVEGTQQTGLSPTAFKDTSRPEKPSIAVLPFRPIGNEGSGDFLGAGLASELIASLSRKAWIRVIADGSSRVVKQNEQDLSEIVKMFGVRYIVQGNYLQSGDRFRLIANLIDGESGEYLSVYRADRRYSDVFDVLDDFSARLIGQFFPEITSRELKQIGSLNSGNLGAWELYLRALVLIHEHSHSSSQQAELLLSESVSLAPDFAAALARLSTCHLQAAYYGWSERSVESLVAESLKCAQQAHAANADEPLAYDALASIHQFSGEHREAIQMAKKALEMSSTCMPAYGTLTTSLALMGEVDESLKFFQESLRISPRDPDRSGCLMGATIAYFISGQYENSIQTAIDHSLLRPNWYGSQIYIAASAALNDEMKQAQKAIARLLDLLPGLTCKKMRDRILLHRSEDIDHLIGGLVAAGLPAE